MVSALRQAVGPDGHVVMPTGTEHNSKTSRAHEACIRGLTPDEVTQYYTRYYTRMPPFDPAATPSGMGAIGESLRTTSGAVRSNHQQSSFAALGPVADLLMADHPLQSHLGMDSPLGKLYKMDARILVIGVGYWACTAFHLAEETYTWSPPKRRYSCVVSTPEGGRWVEYEDVVLDDREFDDIGCFVEEKLPVAKGRVGYASSRLLSLHYAVECAADWMSKRRV